MDEDATDLMMRERLATLARTEDLDVAYARFAVARQRRRRQRRFGSMAAVATVAIAVLAATLALRSSPTSPTTIVTDSLVDSTDTTPERSSDGPTTTLAGPGPAVPDVLGLDYRSALTVLRDVARMPQSGVRVLLSLDTGTTEPFGRVVRSEPAAGEQSVPGGAVVLYVAASRDELGLADPRSLTTGRQPGEPFTDRSLVGSNTTFPPAGLAAGVLDGTAPECEPPNVPKAGQAVRFLDGELVGCWFQNFVWLDQLPTAGDVIAVMPDLVGLSVEDAKLRLREAVPQLNGIVVAGTSLAANETVTGTTPLPGEAVTKLSRVTLYVEVPNR